MSRNSESTNLSARQIEVGQNSADELMNEIKSELEIQLEKEIAELEVDVIESEKLKSQREAEFKSAQEEHMVLKQEIKWDEEQYQLLNESHKELEERVKCLEQELDQVNEETQQTISRLSEARKWRRHQEEKANKVYCESAIWKAIEELRFGDGTTVGLRLQEEIANIKVGVVGKRIELDKVKAERKIVDAKIRGLISPEIDNETRKAVVTSMNDNLRELQKTVMKWTMENRKLDTK